MKKLVGVIIMVCILIVLVGCKKKPETVSNQETTKQVHTQESNVKKEATKEQCFKMIALGMEVVAQQMKGNIKTAEEISREVMELEEQYNADGIDYEEVCQTYMNDPDFIELIQKGTRSK